MGDLPARPYLSRDRFRSDAVEQQRRRLVEWVLPVTEQLFSHWRAEARAALLLDNVPFSQADAIVGLVVENSAECLVTWWLDRLYQAVEVTESRGAAIDVRVLDEALCPPDEAGDDLFGGAPFPVVQSIRTVLSAAKKSLPEGAYIPIQLRDLFTADGVAVVDCEIVT